MNHPHRSTLRVPRALWREARSLIERLSGTIDKSLYTDGGAGIIGRCEAWERAAAAVGTDSGRAQKFTTTLPTGYDERLRAIGHGNASAAIVWLVDHWEGAAHVAASREE